MHWALFVANIINGVIHIYNSSDSISTTNFIAPFRILLSPNTHMNSHRWATADTQISCPQQQDGSQCRVFVWNYMYWLLLGLGSTFDHEYAINQGRKIYGRTLKITGWCILLIVKFVQAFELIILPTFSWNDLVCGNVPCAVLAHSCNTKCLMMCGILLSIVLK